MAGIVALFFIVILSLVVTKIATVALVHTGLSREAAQFQARSAFTGVGFTTHESENIVNHPVRRRITMFLMLLGNAGIVSTVTSLILTFMNTAPTGLSVPYKLLILFLGLTVLWLLARSQWMDRWLSHLITRALEHWSGIKVRDYASLLHLADSHEVTEMAVGESAWMAGKSLAELALSDEGVIVIGIQRIDGPYIGAPDGPTVIEAGDLVTVYGQDDAIKELSQRCCGSEGQAAHVQGVARHRAELKASPSPSESP